MTNHELVKYFRAWLTSPTEKESARQRFKVITINPYYFVFISNFVNVFIETSQFMENHDVASLL